MRAEWMAFYESEYHRVVRFLVLAGASLAHAQEAAREAFVAWWAVAGIQPDHWWDDIPSKPAWIRWSALSRYSGPSGVRARSLPSAQSPELPGTDPDLARLPAGTHAVLAALWALDSEGRAVMAYAIDGFAAADTARSLRLGEQRVRDATAAARGWLGEALAGYDRLDVLLADASRQILVQVEELADMAGVLTRIMTESSLWVPVSMTTAPVAVLIRARVRARRLADAIADALTPALALRNGVAGLDRDRAIARVAGIGKALDRARDLLASLGPDIDLGIDLERDAGLAGSLAAALADGTDAALTATGDIIVALLGDLGDARFRATDLARGLAALPADASGADLSAVEIGNLAVLHGVTWTPQTTWPPRIVAQVRDRSEEIRPGIYQVRIPY